jgi:hypothetical protein
MSAAALYASLSPRKREKRPLSGYEGVVLPSLARCETGEKSLQFLAAVFPADPLPRRSTFAMDKRILAPMCALIFNAVLSPHRQCPMNLETAERVFVMLTWHKINPTPRRLLHYSFLFCVSQRLCILLQKVFHTPRAQELSQDHLNANVMMMMWRRRSFVAAAHILQMKYTPGTPQSDYYVN